MSSTQFVCSIEACGEIFDSKRGKGVHESMVHADDETYECGWCGNELDIPKSRAECSENNFCDYECMGEYKSEHNTGENHANWKGGDAEVVCDWCGDMTTVPPANTRMYDHNFCNNDCKLNWMHEERRGTNKVEVTCSFCGKTTEKWPYKVKQNDENFCGRDCWRENAKENWVGENHPKWSDTNHNVRNTKEYEETMCSVLERDNYTCQDCGHEEDLSPHHIIPISEDESKATDMKNCVTVCQQCHWLRHHERGDQFAPSMRSRLGSLNYRRLAKRTFR